MEMMINPGRKEWEEICQRPTIDQSELEQLVSEIFAAVANNGDKAVVKYNKLFGGTNTDSLWLTDEEIKVAEQKVDEQLKKAIAEAQANITRFHESQALETKMVETTPGVSCWQKQVSIDKVGIYIPGGSAPLFSTVLMLGIPAKIAGCKEIVLCTPPNDKGNIAPEILYTASLLGIRKIIKAGGIQAIAAMTHGTESVSAVYKIFGPGNQYVTAAKTYAQRLSVAIDMPAGPSEVLIFCDDTAEPAFVAADLLSQAEHGSDSQVVLIGQSAKTLLAVQESVQEQLTQLPRRSIAEEALENARFLVIEKESEALDFINTYAPEHLILVGKNQQEWASKINNAGSVFIGPYSAESFGDYASGTNHTLPTSGFARTYSGVSLQSFCKTITFQQVSQLGLKNLGPFVAVSYTHLTLPTIYSV